MNKLVDCLTCGKKVAYRAHKCQHCGEFYFRKGYDKNIVFLLISFILIIAGVTMFISDLIGAGF
tara:strand:- start:136 stop:327 length:192 start_codon:yes stop_codon:yes gene_type:complete